MKRTASADVVIFGGGIAGLWLLNRVRQAGFSAILLETATLGGGQTHKSQGIIHGGIKYALQGMLTAEAKAMLGLPEIWNQCLAGKGEINLSNVPILSKQQCLWAPSKLAAKLTGLLANAALASAVKSLDKSAYPAVFQHPDFKGQVFSLAEVVLDIPSLVRELAKTNQDVIFKINTLKATDFIFDENNNLLAADICLTDKVVRLNAQHFIFTAGSGNAVIIDHLKQPQIAMQKRPLHMVLVKTPFDFPLYAHCLSLGTKPRLTITTHRTQEGATVWYLGGQLAEAGVNHDALTQIANAKKELAHLFPWLDFSQASFASFMIERAEPLQKNGLKPETVFVKTFQNMTIAWPTKLALAPLLANTILSDLEDAGLKASCLDIRELRAWPIPPFAQPIWETLFCKND